MAREFLMIVTESAYGTPTAAPVLGTDKIYVRLDEGGAFNMVGDNLFYEIMYGGGRANKAVAGSDQVECKGQLKTKLYGSQAVFLSNWFAQTVNAGLTLPWVTTDVPGDLATCSVYHAVQRSDGTYKRVRFAGCKVASWKIEISRDSKIGTLTLDLVAQKYVGNSYDSSTDPDATEFPAPADADYPTDPFRYIDLSGRVTVGTARTMFSSVALNVTNKLDPRWFESRFLQVCPFLGRETTLDLVLYYKPTPDDLASYQNLAVQAGSVALDNGTHSLTVNMNAHNLFRKLTKTLPVDRVYELPVTLENLWDPAAGTDLTVTAT